MESRKAVRLIGSAESCLAGDVLLPFALEELECRRTGEDGVPAVHLWRHERAVVLGVRDRKLPAAEEAVAWLERQGYRVGVRSSGGAAVPLDEGVLNVTLILPREPGRFGLRDDFGLMADVILGAARACGLEARVGEIAGSYCPGEFDVGADGRKFCGIAQRRLVRAVAVQAFVSVTGPGAGRANLIRSYYERAGGPAAEPGGRRPYPDVKAESAASLEELLEGRAAPDVPRFAGRVLEAVRELLGAALEPCEPAAAFGEVRAMADLLRRRYDR